MHIDATTPFIDYMHAFLLWLALLATIMPATGLPVREEILLRASLLGATDGGTKMATLVIFGIRFFTLMRRSTWLAWQADLSIVHFHRWWCSVGA
jgi:hypothetical protein